MPVFKREYPSGAIKWSYKFNGPGATRADPRTCTETGFDTKKEAQSAEAQRRIEVQKQFEAEQATASKPKEIQRTLRDLLLEFCAWGEKGERLSPTTTERYRRFIPYVHESLMEMLIHDLTPYHFNREWDRLEESGGHHRRTKKSRPLSKKTVRHIAGFVSAAFNRGIKWQIPNLTNPVTHSEPPKPPKRYGQALTVEQQEVTIGMASGPWCISAYLNVQAGTGARRGEGLALRWSDIEDGDQIWIRRNLVQAGDKLSFKSTKEGEERLIALAPETVIVLEKHRAEQDKYKAQFGKDYKHDLDLIFAHEDGSPFRPHSISSTVSQLCRRLKLPKGISLHTLRHTHGSHLLASDVPLIDVATRLGHSDPRTTAKVYSHQISGQDKKAVKKWAEYQKANAPQKGREQ